jgi:hypothetical protein
MLPVLAGTPSHAAKERVVKGRFDNVMNLNSTLEATALKGETTVLVVLRDDTGIDVIGSVDGENFCGSRRFTVKAGQKITIRTAYGFLGYTPPCPQGVAGDFIATFS